MKWVQIIDHAGGSMICVNRLLTVWVPIEIVTEGSTLTTLGYLLTNGEFEK